MASCSWGQPKDSHESDESEDESEDCEDESEDCEYYFDTDFDISDSDNNDLSISDTEPESEGKNSLFLLNEKRKFIYRTNLTKFTIFLNIRKKISYICTSHQSVG